MKRKLLSIAFLTGIVFFGCNKPTKVTNHPINADLKAAFNYQKGSYWVYRDSISGMIDSFYVTNNNSQTVHEAGRDFAYEEIDIHISELNIAPLPVIPFLQNWQFNYYESSIEAFFTDSNIYTNKIEYGTLVNYPFKNVIVGTNYGTGIAYGSSAKDTVTNIFSSYLVFGQSFSNIAEVNHTADLSVKVNSPKLNPYSYNDWFYISADAGIIKMRLYHSADTVYKRVWEIQRWKIIK